MRVDQLVFYAVHVRLPAGVAYEFWAFFMSETASDREYRTKRHAQP